MRVRTPQNYALPAIHISKISIGGINLMIAIYARVSTDDQVKHGYSLQGQLKECQKKAGSSDLLEYIDEGISGEFLDRPALSKLRKDIKEGLITKVICLDPDRLSRKLMNQLIISEELDKHGVELVFVNGEYAKTPEGTLFYSLRGAIAEFEKAKITERMSRGRREKARQGKVLRDFNIYGYAYDSKAEQIIINEKESEVVRFIFNLFIQPNDLVEGINGIAKYLTSLGIPTKKGSKVWHRQVVRQILMNRVYIGEFYQNRWNSEGMLGNKYKDKEDRISLKQRAQEEWILIPCPPIIDKDAFEHAQILLEESRRRWTKKSKNKYLLSGLVRCGECGNTMTGRKAKNWGKHVFEYTDLKNTAGASNKGCGHKVRCEELDVGVWEQIVRWLNNPEEIAKTPEIEDVPIEKFELEKYEKEIQNIRAKRKRLLELFAEEVEVSKEDLTQMLKDLKEREQYLHKEIDRLKGRVNEEGNDKLRKKLLEEAIQYYLSVDKEEITFEQKQQLIRFLVREIRAYKEQTHIYFFYS